MKEEQNQATNPNSQFQNEEFDFSKADLDDIVFMYRNMDYGAYQLRKQYPRNLVNSFIIAALLFLLLINFQNIVNAIQGLGASEDEHTTVVELTEISYVEAEKHLPLAPEIPRAAQKKAPIDAGKPKVKLDKQVKDVPQSKPEELKDSEENSNSEGSHGTPNGDDEASDTTKADTPSPEKPVSTGEPQKVYLEQVPSYSGGEKEMLRFIYANIRYPDVARDAGIVGTAYITFIVEKDGSISNVVIKQDLGGGCGNEAARVVRLMPKWVPGKLAGRPIRAMFTLPIEFKLLDE